MRWLLILLVAGLMPVLFCGCRKAGPPRQEETAMEVKSVDPESAPFVAGKRNKVYHARGCPYAANLSSPVGFASVLEAEASGRIPCEFCAPRTSNKQEP